MIICMHSHLFFSPDQLGESYLEQWVRISTVLANRPPERLREAMQEWWDPTGEIFIKEMDEAKKSEVRGEKQKISKEMRERLRSLGYVDK